MENEGKICISIKKNMFNSSAKSVYTNEIDQHFGGYFVLGCLAVPVLLFNLQEYKNNDLEPS